MRVIGTVLGSCAYMEHQHLHWELQKCIFYFEKHTIIPLNLVKIIGFRGVCYSACRDIVYCIGHRQSFITVFIKQFYFAMLRDSLVMPSRRVQNVCKDFQSIKITVTVKNGRYDFSISGLKPSIVPLSDEKLMPMAIIVRLSAA